ncbi:hypothetical protein RRG08_013691 [Elysia crispata]|uniref:Uncharacterized protein n=1 Tax=Elysia crispata TaxID=231223 RepID=A0AAE0ZMP0_9GAST|nr:hypothetical protein RRG08_013691 [Elysia crispata]
MLSHSEISAFYVLPLLQKARKPISDTPNQISNPSNIKRGERGSAMNKECCLGHGNTAECPNSMCNIVFKAKINYSDQVKTDIYADRSVTDKTLDSLTPVNKDIAVSRHAHRQLEASQKGKLDCG